MRKPRDCSAITPWAPTTASTLPGKDGETFSFSIVSYSEVYLEVSELSDLALDMLGVCWSELGSCKMGFVRVIYSTASTCVWDYG